MLNEKLRRIASNRVKLSVVYLYSEKKLKVMRNCSIYTTFFLSKCFDMCTFPCSKWPCVFKNRKISVERLDGKIHPIGVCDIFVWSIHNEWANKITLRCFDNDICEYFISVCPFCESLKLTTIQSRIPAISHCIFMALC